MGPEGVGNDSISQIAQNASEGLLVTLPKSFDPIRPTLPSLKRSSRKEDPSGPFVFPAYSAVEVIAGGIAAAKAKTPPKWPQPSTPATFKTPTGDLS
jgi:branched-chain amino acid transport system substrate-binding protein